MVYSQFPTVTDHPWRMSGGPPIQKGCGMADPRVARIRSRVTSLWSKLRASTMARAALITGVLAIVCKGIGFAKELVIASQFGIGPVLDSFLVAVVVPQLVCNVFAHSFAASLVMRYVRNRIQLGEDAAREGYATSLFWGTLLVVSLSVTGVTFGPALLPWLSPGFRPELMASTQRLLWMLLPYSILAGTGSIWSAVLNARGRFAASAISSGVISLGLIAAVLGWHLRDARVLVGGLTFGAFIDVVILGFCLSREGLPLIPKASRWRSEDRWIVAHTLPMMAGSTLHFCTLMVDQSMASMLGEGSVSELNYGNRFVAMILGLIGMPVGKVLFPHFVKLVETRKWAEAQRSLRQSVLFLLAISIPITIVLAGFSEPIVNWTFRRGQFTSEMVTRVSAVQVMCAMQIPFYLWSVLMARMAVALQMRRVMVGCGVINLAMNIAMNYALMGPLGVPGIALSTAIVYLGASCYFSAVIGAILRRKLQEQEEIDQAAEAVSKVVEAPRLAA